MNHENVSKILDWLIRLPKGYKVATTILIASLALVYLLTACGTTKAVVKQPKQGSTTTISVTTSNPTSITTEVPVSVTLKKKVDTLKIHK